MPHPDQFPGQCCSLSYPISILMCPQEEKGGGCLINIVCREFGFTMWTIWSGYNYPTLGYQKGRSAPSSTPLVSYPCCFTPLREGDPSSPKLHIMCPSWAPALCLKLGWVLRTQETPQSGWGHTEIDNQNPMWIYHGIKYRVLWGHTPWSPNSCTMLKRLSDQWSAPQIGIGEMVVIQTYGTV